MTCPAQSASAFDAVRLPRGSRAWVVALLFTLLGEGCAFMTAYVHVSPDADVQRPQLPPMLLVDACVDQRPQVAAGVKKNAFGRETAPVLFSAPPCPAIRERLAARFATPPAGHPPVASVRLTLLQLFVEPSIEYPLRTVAKATALVRIQLPDGSILERRFCNVVQGPMSSFVDSDDQALIESAAGGLIDKIAAGLGRLLKKRNRPPDSVSGA